MSLSPVVEPVETTFRTQFIGPNAYIRLHGRNANAWYAASPEQNGSDRYDYEYSEGELKGMVNFIYQISKV